MKVAWVAEIPVPYRLGLYRRLRAEAGIDLRLFFCSTRQPDRDWQPDLEGVPHTLLRGVTLAVRPREQYFMRVNPGVWRELSRFAPDRVVVGGYAHLTMQWAMLWCRWTGTPYLVNSESHHRKGSGQWSVVSGQSSRSLLATGHWPLTTALKRFFVSGAAACLPAGSLAAEYLISYGGRPDRMYLLPNTCDVAWFARESECARGMRATIRQELGLSDGPVVMVAGRLTHAKGLDVLIRAFADYPDCESGTKTGLPDESGLSVSANPQSPNRNPQSTQLLLVGDGEQRAELAALTEELGVADRVRFAGSRAWAELPRLYAAADLFVLPSRFEPWGAVVNEAIACGLPVIVSDQVGCAPDLVRPGENGWVVPADDVPALTAALREALADPERLRTMGAASARLAPAWGEERCLASLTAALRSVVNGR